MLSEEKEKEISGKHLQKADKFGQLISDIIGWIYTLLVVFLFSIADVSFTEFSFKMSIAVSLALLFNYFTKDYLVRKTKHFINYLFTNTK